MRYLFLGIDGAGALPLLLPEDAARRVRDFYAQPYVPLIGLFIAWRVFGRVFDPVFTFALNALYPGAGYH